MLLDQVREQARLQRLSLATERCYCHRVERHVRSHRAPDGWRHPRGLTAADLERFVGAGKARMAAVGACMRKLLMIAYGVLKSRTPFDPSRGAKMAP